MTETIPTHLAPDEILADYACGAMTPGMSLLIASHLTHSAEARLRVREFERIGGILLAEEDPAEMPEGAVDAALKAIDTTGATGEALGSRPGPAGPLPRPVSDRIGMSFDEIPWKFRLPGISVFDLDGFPDEKVWLLRARPGATVPQHTHEGLEATLVMHGCLLDEGVEYRAGDMVVNDEDVDHRPQVLGDETCYCLIVQQGDVRFTGTFSRILNLLGE